MEARKLLEAAPFDRETVDVLKQAFEEAWASIESTIARDWIDNIRISLAHAIVAHACAGEIDSERLKITAFRGDSEQSASGAY